MSEEIEYLDIVDENDNVIGKEERGLAHGKHLRHRASHIVVINSKGEYLLQLRKKDKKQYPLYWAVTAGHVSAGKTYEETAHEEVEEELGVKLPLEVIGKFEIDNEVENEVCQTYATQSDGPFVMQEEEIEELRFFSYDDIPEKVTPHSQQAIKLYREKKELK